MPVRFYMDHHVPLRVSIGTCIDDLETIARAAAEDDVVGQILFLPL